MSIISRDLDRDIVFEGRRYDINLAFDVVLRFFELQRDEDFSAVDRLRLSVEMFAGRRAARLPIAKQEALLAAINERFLKSEGKQADGPRVLDFWQDADYIYAAFMQAYGIDLQRERGRMDWRSFIALFRGLPDDTRLREIMSIRRRDLPEITKYNMAEVAALQEMKDFYSLELSPEEEAEEYQRSVDRLAARVLGSMGV